MAKASGTYGPEPRTWDESVATFWSRVDRDGDCWVWTGSRTDRGYGRYWDSRSKKTVRAHRFAWEATHGRPPASGLLHACDNPPCVRPAHLREGTQGENNVEAWRRGSGRNGTIKLTAAQVMEIRDRAARGESRSDLAARFDCTPTNIRFIVQRKTWRGLP